MSGHEPVLVLPRKAYRRDRRRWLEARRSGIGGSDAAAVVGLSPWASPLSLWVEKVRDVEDAGQTEAMRWGTVLEDAIAREMAKEHGISLGPCPGILAHPERRWQIATIDRYGVHRHTREPNAVVEVKNTNAFGHADWPADGPPPDHVVIQVQHQLDVTGLEVGYVAALVGGNTPRWWEIFRDGELIGSLRAEEARFWSEHVLTGQPPDPIGHDADGDALADLYPGDPGRELILDRDLLALIEQRQAARVAAAELAAIADGIDLQIKATLGPATEGLRPDGSTAVTWRPSSTTRLDSNALKADQPDLWAQYAKTTEGRRLLVKPLKAKEAGRATAAA
jgi:putative phage-type endonuclease